MNFLHLRYFLMVAEELNITRAAERLYISQQSLSNHISNMEKELDVKLFTRSPKLSLTYAGDLLVQTATQILDLYSQYMTKVGDINRHYLGVLRVGISHTCGLALLPVVLPQFRKEFPMVEFSLYEGNSTQLEDALSHGRVDLIICFQPIMIEGVTTVPLTEQRLMMVVPKPFPDQRFGIHAEEVRLQYAQGADISAFQQFPVAGHAPDPPPVGAAVAAGALRGLDRLGPLIPGNLLHHRFIGTVGEFHLSPSVSSSSSSSHGGVSS